LRADRGVGHSVQSCLVTVSRLRENRAETALAAKTICDNAISR
jgi:hypothetical protein